MTTEDFKRKLTAILSADVVGYSRLMGEDEAATVKTLETYKGVMFSLIRQHRGRVVDSPGDNLLAEFGSVVDAVQCSVSIQKELQARNADLSENRRMEFRIGINLGDVIEEEDRIYGDGVNIAARLEALADPGGICISKTAFDHIESKLPLGYEFLGEQIVKNIAKPVGAYKVLMEKRVVDAKTKREAKAVSFWRRKSVLYLGIIVILAIVAVLYWNFYPRETSIEPEQVTVLPDVKEAPKTIAVLAFTDLSPEKDQEYFVDGLSEEILNSLTKIPDLLVTGRTSSFSFKGSKKKVQEIANELGVENILEGSVRKAGNALRITAQLLRGADGFHLWSETYDRELKDIFAVQEDIATAVADELKVTFGIDQFRRRLGSTDNLEAYELYLFAKGLYFTNDAPHALEAIGRAIALDPEFALAWAYKAVIHWEALIFAPGNIAPFERNAGLKAALRSIELEPDLGEAYLSLGSSRLLRGEFMEAELAYRKGMELTTESINPWEYGICIHYNSVGYFKRAHEIIEAARRNDPLNKVGRAVYMSTLGLIGDVQGAEEEYERGKALFGDDWFWGDRWIIWLRLGAKDVVSRDEIPAVDLIHDVAKKYLESPEEGLAELRRLYISENNLHSGNFACIAEWAAYFDDPEFALNAMERSVKLNASALSLIWHPLMKEVRQLPRFKEFIREIGLVDFWNKFGWPDLCRPIGDDDFECD
jgi:adenylate cyclase